jgi:hypothetical protein
LATTWRTTRQGLITLKKSSSAFQASGSPPLEWNTLRARDRSASPSPLIALPDSGGERYPKA